MIRSFRMFTKKKPRVILVLGGGSARGFAHIGVLKVLEEERIPIDAVVGTSIGALVAAMYSVGIPLTTIEKHAEEMSLGKLVDFIFPKVALIEGIKMEKVIARVLEGKTFSDARVPLYIVTTDIERNEEVVLTSGDLTRSIRASCSWPGVFMPVTIDGRLLVDGGLKNSVPTKIARTLGPAFVIASDVGFCVKNEKLNGILPLLLQTFQIMGEELNRYQNTYADVVIKPHLEGCDQAGFHKARVMIDEGEEAARAMIKEIKRRVGVDDGPEK